MLSASASLGLRRSWPGPVGMLRHSIVAYAVTLGGPRLSSSIDMPTTCVMQVESIVIARRYRRPSNRTTLRADERDLEEEVKAKEDEFVHTTKAAVGRPEEGQRGFLGIGRKGRSMPLNPLLVLNKVEDPATKKVLLAVRKLKNNPESMQLSENEQQHVVNAYASTKWYATLWSPLKGLNYKSLRRWNYFAAFLFTVCFVAIMCCMVLLYRIELVAFQNLTEAEQKAYLDIVMHMRYSEIHDFGAKLLKTADPYEILPHDNRLQLVVQGLMKEGVHLRDWVTYERENYKTTAWVEKDWVHLGFWAVMYFGRSVTGGLEFYPDHFGDVGEIVSTGKQKAADEMRSLAPHGPQVKPVAAAATAQAAK